ncbi:redoxin domain-containing protein [bacterium]|nr:redoxin domain-containing protein [bacterium]
MRNLRFIVLIATVFTITLALRAIALQTGEKAPGFKLNDQFGKTWDLSSLSGKVVVVVVANRDSGRAMGPWVDNLKKKYGDKIQLLGLMDLHTIPGIGRGIAKSRIRKETKDPLMLDFNGSTAKAYDVSGKIPVVVVIDQNSVVKAVQKNEYSTDRFKSISNAVDAALK